MATALEPTALRPKDASSYPTLDEAVSRDEAERIAKLFKALADPTRVQLLGLLKARPGGECGYDLTGPLGISQPSVSYHVRILYEAGLVTRERRGSWVFYRICEERLADIRRAAGPARPNAGG
ncbi:MAG: ArsR/SmtB family transcription factor [Acidimicrobiales bacterium]